MAIDITEEIENFQSAIYGKEVRGSLVSFAEKVKDEVDQAIENQLIQVDPELTEAGQGADAKVTGDEIRELKSQINKGTGLTADIKVALMDVVNHIGVWTDGNAQTYIANLQSALYPPAELVSISAVYSGSSVTQGTALTDLKSDLVVTALYDDSTTETVASADYTLSGDLNTVGTSTITVTYEGKTTTFTVTVDEGSALIYELANTVSTANYDTGVQLFNPEPMSFSIFCEATFANSGWSGRQSIFGLGDTTAFRVGQGTVNGTAYKTCIFLGGNATSIFASSASAKRRFAFSYDNSTGTVNAYAKVSGAEIGNLRTFTAGSLSTDTRTVKFNCGATSTTIPISEFKVYGKVLSNEDMYAWVNTLE